MTPEAFAARYPRLYRLSYVGSMTGIRVHGLLTARQLAERGGVTLEPTPRRTAMHLTLPGGHPATITDNRPLSVTRLARILDDGLTPADWIALLNDRVFFWPDRTAGESNLKARRALGYDSQWHVFDTLALLTPVWDRAEITPFNTGATVRMPPRRGRATFAPLSTLDFEEWRAQRRRIGTIHSLDSVREITVRGGVPHAANTLLEVVSA